MFGGKRGQVFDSALGPHPPQLCRLRQFDSGGEPISDLFGRNFGTIGVGVIFGAGNLRQNAIGALCQQFFNHAPLLGINRCEQLAVMRAFFLPKHRWKRAFAARLIAPLRDKAARLRLCGDRQSQPRQGNCRKSGAFAH